MGFIREPLDVEFTLISREWTPEEEKELSEYIAKQKEIYHQQQAAKTTAKKRPVAVRKACIPLEYA